MHEQKPGPARPGFFIRFFSRSGTQQLYHHAMKIFSALLVSLALSAPPALARDVLRGPAEAVDGSHLRIMERTVRLAGIVAPGLRTPCLWKGKTPRDCGRMARAAVSDLTAGAQVICREDSSLGGWRCLSDGYDISEGLIHAGWARPVKGAPEEWHDEERRARRKGLMLWRATTLDGESFMEHLAASTDK